ncbi:NAD-dependent epimerase/dehydratase family protein [Cohnella herbarum]|uniref:NAD(P)-dependent oxidoreductase n=1 Tax=Cohnella herbarum TaxID=2728023 RepID=A0A7Z2VLR3_9BACL|nr:NAD(P)-dependent oxidoreductase [Cohnella herbarum]QJD85259.1 NAD(P)-dependent oxidoreductase [Cohnella herbarum]
MKILAIGSEGNIGKELVKYLRKQNHHVIECDIIPGWRKDYYQADINIAIDLMDVFMKEKPDVVYLLAAMVSRVTCEASSGLAVETNLVGVNNVIQLCKKFDSKMVYFSTSEVYGNIQGYLDEDTTVPQPNNRYGLTKYLGEKLVQYEALNNGLKAVAVRPFMFYHEDETRGDHRSAMIRFIEGLSNRKQIEVHVGSERAWFHLDDAVRALEKVIYLKQFEIINIGSDEFVKTEDLAKLVATELNVNLEEYANFIELPNKMTLVKRPKLDKMKNLLGIVPEVGLAEGIKRVLSKF